MLKRPKFRQIAISLGAGLLLAGQPLAAQPMENGEGDEALAAIMGMFKAEPLTPEQEARLPLATEVVERVIPPGSMGEMMGSMFDGMFGELMKLPSKPGASAVAEQMGLGVAEISLEGDEAEEAMAILDPAWQARKEREAAVMPEVLKGMMTAMEPTMRKAMSEIYAVHFDSGELTDINAFFQTESGANFARKSFTIASDPRIMQASMESLPLIMGSIGEMEDKVKAATAGLPAARRFGDLSAAERARLAELTGVDEASIGQAMANKTAADMAAEEAADVVE